MVIMKKDPNFNYLNRSMDNSTVHMVTKFYILYLQLTKENSTLKLHNFTILTTHKLYVKMKE